MNFKLTYSDFLEVSKYIEKQCDHSDLMLGFDALNRLVIKTCTKYGEEVTITVFDGDHSKFPTLTKTGRLNDEDSK